MTISRKPLSAAVAAAVVAIFALTGCGADTAPVPSPSASDPATTASPTPLPPTTPSPTPDVTEPADPADEPGAGTDYAQGTELYEFPQGENTYTVGADTVVCEADEVGTPASAVSVTLSADGAGIDSHSCLYEVEFVGDETSDEFFDMGEEG